MSITVAITSYNRCKCLHELTKTLKMQGDCTIVVVDDASICDINKEHIDIYHRNNKNNGKHNYWKTVNTLWGLALSTKSEYFIMIPDDYVPLDGYFERSIELWESIQDNKKIALHLTNNNRVRNWTNFNRVDYDKNLYLTQTTEFHFLCKREFISYKIKPVSMSRWNKNSLLGSGVGDQLNMHWVRSGKNIYGVKKSLIKKNTNCPDSVMNYEERKRHPGTIV